MSGSSNRPLAVALFACITLTAPILRAEVLALSWTAPPECPTREQVEEEFLRIVPPAVLQSQDSLNAEAIITQIASGYRLSLKTQSGGADGTAEVDSATCEPLKGAATLLLALAASRTEEPPPPQPIPKKGPLLPDFGGLGEFGQEKPAPEAPPKPMRIRVGALGHWSPNFLPETAFGATVRAQLVSGMFGYVFAANVWLPQTTEIESGIRAEYASASVQLGACADWLNGPPRFNFCVSGLVGAIQGGGVGTAKDQQVLAPIYGVVPAVELSVPLGLKWLHGQVGYQLQLMAARPEFSVEQVIAGEPNSSAQLVPLYRTPFAVHDVLLGLAVEF